MSSTLMYRAIPDPPPPPDSLPYDLKRAISQRFWGHDGSLGGESVVLEGDPATIHYLHGLIDAGVDGAYELLDAIIHSHAVEVWIEP